MITLALLTWNDPAEVILENIQALVNEAARFPSAEVLVLDNGSDVPVIAPESVTTIRLAVNQGAAAGRNRIAQQATENGSRYLFYCDGDITCVPGSVVSMVNCMDQNPHIPVLGSQWWNFATAKGTESPFFHQDITNPQLCSSTPWAFICPSQYGLWNRQTFTTVHWDEIGFPAGYGGEDNDYALTMQFRHGLEPYYFDQGIRYLHRHAHGSIAKLKAAGHNPQQLLDQRIAYMLEKFADVPEAVPWLRSIVGGEVPTPER